MLARRSAPASARPRPASHRRPPVLGPGQPARIRAADQRRAGDPERAERAPLGAGRAVERGPAPAPRPNARPATARWRRRRRGGAAPEPAAARRRHELRERSCASASRQTAQAGRTEQTRRKAALRRLRRSRRAASSGSLLLEVALEGPDVVGRHRVVERAGDQLAFLVAGDGGDEGVEADLDLGDPAVEPGVLDRGALDRDQPVVEDVAGGLALVDRGLEGGADLVVGEEGELLAVALPEGFEHHPIGGLGALEEAGDVEAGIGGDDRADAGGGALLIGEAARLGADWRRASGVGGGGRGAPARRSGRVTGCCSWPVRWPSTA